jgi:2-haloalkanoic acid dehalogenase type II
MSDRRRELPPCRAVLFDLLTALLDSWSLWNSAANSEADGRRWRAEYLRLTYGCGAYRPYEMLVREAAAATGLTAAAAERLEAQWDELAPWSGANEALDRLAGRVKLAVVTNCSRTLGWRAAARIKVRWDAVITAEEAGYYKPHPRPYQLALERLRVSPVQCRFVAGSGYDLFGTEAVGLRTYWHNRARVAPPLNAPQPEVLAASLDGLSSWVLER